MKRPFHILPLVVAFFTLLPFGLSAQTQDNALYVYRNDGDFTAFLREDIDSIVLSHYDKDSVYQKECVMQVFYTPDSIYRIPIAAIDSVSLVQPETKYQDNVFLIESKHVPYIVAVTDSTITFSSSTPSSLLPTVGNVLAAMVFDSPLDNGFSGRVESAEADGGNIKFICSEVSIGDIYKRIVYTSKFEAYANEASGAKMQKRQKRSTGQFDPTYIGTISAEAGPVSVSAEPTISGFYTINHEENLKTHAALIVKADINTEIAINAKIENPTNDPQIAWCPQSIRIPTNVPGLTANIRGGAFFKLSASADITAKWPGHLSGKIGFTMGDDGTMVINSMKYTTEQTELSINMNGEIDLGLCVRIGMTAVDDDLLSAYITGFGGVYAKADFALTSEGLSDGTLYSVLKDSKVEVGGYFAGEPGYTFWGKEHKIKVPGTSDKDISLQWSHPIPWKSWYLLPEFTKPQYTKGSNSATAVITTKPSRDLLIPVCLGIGVENESGEKVTTQWSTVEYQKEDEWQKNGLSQSFSGLSGKYTAYPYVRIFGLELRATPECEFDTDRQYVKLSNFNITSSQHKANAFINDGKSYDYMCNCSITVTLDCDDEVDDWGYVYEDLDGSTKLISLKRYGSPYTDSRFAYYRNSMPSYVRLYGYVQLQGQSDYIYDTPQDFKLFIPVCPDENHPHMIDLGMPSGTKWACCNIEASSPEDYGGYYAWGETEEKTNYEWETYSYSIYNDEGHQTGCVNIGSDIASSNYDVAHVKWGGIYRMPNRTQFEELINYCTWTTIRYNGVNGGLVIGSNGNSVFLPAAGYYQDMSLEFINGNGLYWTSSFLEDSTYSPFVAYIFVFNIGSSAGVIMDFTRLNGMSVRPVTE